MKRLVPLTVSAALWLLFLAPVASPDAGVRGSEDRILGRVDAGDKVIVFEAAKLDETRVEQLRMWDEFAKDHPQILDQLAANPSLLLNQKYLRQHPALQRFLDQHPDIHQAMIAHLKNFVVALTASR
jgi:hypothetical protein